MRHHHARYRHGKKGKAYMPDSEQLGFPYVEDWYTRKAKEPPISQQAQPQAQPEARHGLRLRPRVRPRERLDM